MSTDQQHRPARQATVVGLYVVAAAAAILSFGTLDALGKYAGFTADWSLFGAHVYQSWLLPISIDALGFMATRVWFDDRFQASTRGLARIIALVDVTVSMILNAAMHTAHVLVPGGPAVDRFRLTLVIAVSLIPPLAFAVAAHLGATVSDDTGSGTVEQGPPELAPTAVEMDAWWPDLEEVFAGYDDVVEQQKQRLGAERDAAERAEADKALIAQARTERDAEKAARISLWDRIAGALSKAGERPTEAELGKWLTDQAAETGTVPSRADVRERWQPAPGNPVIDRLRREVIQARSRQLAVDVPEVSPEPRS